MFLFNRSDNSAHSSEPFPLHRAVFYDEKKQLIKLLKLGNLLYCVYKIETIYVTFYVGHDVNKQDPHGNTALHLAVMLDRKGILLFF